jgi:uncharacterized protein YacL
MAVVHSEAVSTTSAGLLQPPAHRTIMALVILRLIFVMACVGIAVLIFNFDVVPPDTAWMPPVVIAAMLALPLVVIGIDMLIRRKDLTTITAVYFGMIIGVFLTYVALLILTPLLPLNRKDPVWSWLPLVLGSVSCYATTSLLLQTRDDFRFLIPYVEFARDVRGLRPNVLDTASIVDGRVAELAEARVFESRFVVPSFVLKELQAAAESGDRQRRSRGRRGLDVLSRLQANTTVDIDVLSPTEADEDHEATLESRVVAMAGQLGGRVITTDPNVVKIAAVQSVPSLSIQELALAMKPTYVPGDALTVRLIKQGEEPDQGVGYLEDGTMVVVENGRGQIGRTVNVAVTSTLQTTAGRLVFARPPDPRS